MTHKTGRPNHQLPTRLRVALPNAPFAQPGPPAGSPRSVGANLVAALARGQHAFPSRATPSLPAFAPLASNSSAWTNSFGGRRPRGASKSIINSPAKPGQGRGGVAARGEAVGRAPGPRFGLGAIHVPAHKVREGQSPSPLAPPRASRSPPRSLCLPCLQARTSPRLAGRVTAQPRRGLEH